MEEFYHNHNATGMVIAPHLYGSINRRMEAETLPIRFGPPAHEGTVQTQDIDIHAATGIYLPSELLPIDVSLPTLTLENALSTLYKARGIEKEAAGVTVRPSAARTCG